MAMKIVSVSLPTEQAKELRQRAKKNKVPQSQIVREALRRYELSQRWAQIREWGKETALKFNITSYDDVDRIAGKR